MFSLEEIMESFDLAGIYGAACALGVVLCACAMSMIPKGSNAALHWVQRFSYLSIGLVMVWSFLYANEKSWQPHPPQLVLVLVLDCIMFARIVLRRTDFLESKI
jgi:hypothetical protein